MMLSTRDDDGSDGSGIPSDAGAQVYISLVEPARLHLTHVHVEAGSKKIGRIDARANGTKRGETQ
jgi:hypothetical protein